MTAAAATSLADMDSPDLWCLAQGPDGDQHLYAGGAGLYETDVSSALPLLSWNPIPLIDDQGGPIGTVFRALALSKPRKLVLATATGVYYADIPAVAGRGGCLMSLISIIKPTAPRQYTLHKVKNIPIPAETKFAGELPRRRLEWFGRRRHTGWSLNAGFER